MSLARFMHPRNKYVGKPNFKTLAIKYPEFREIAITELTGKVRINFKDEKSLRILTETLLKHDFNLEVHIPPEKLVPALPLRLNYILWMEDILKYANFTETTNIRGIDIGTGAICIYPLLIAKLYEWKMTATEIDPESVQSAIENAAKNNLQHLINVILVSKDSILKNIFQENETYTFAMCNPPFFEIDKLSRIKLKQKPPRNAPTGNENELIVEGGETNFILRLIEDSMQYKKQVKIYTTMFGKKSTLAVVRKELSERNITNTTWTEFCQGHTKRWGLAWTFLPEEIVNLKTAPVIRTRMEVSPRQKDRTYDIDIPITKKISSIEDLSTVLENWLKELNVRIKQLNFDEECLHCAYQMTAFEDSWTHARRKRRMAMRHESFEKKLRLENDLSQSSNAEDNTSIQTNLQINTDDRAENSEEKVPYLVCSIILQEGETEKLFRISMIFDDGTGGKNALESLRQYLINKLDVREYFMQQNANKKHKASKEKKKSQA